MIYIKRKLNISAIEWYQLSIITKMKMKVQDSTYIFFFGGGGEVIHRNDNLLKWHAFVVHFLSFFLQFGALPKGAGWSMLDLHTPPLPHEDSIAEDRN